MFFRFLKKLEDLFLAFAVIILLGPFLLLIICAYPFIEGWPIFYISKRMIGINKEIKIFKFRSMVKDASDPKYELESKYMIDGYLDIPLSDKVYTRLGKFLEKTQIVEVPQIIHVLTGKLSFIGNRPLPKSNIEILKKSFPDLWYLRFESPAGLTGISQVVGKFNLTAKKRLELESLYSRVYNEGNILKADIYIFFSTIVLILLRHPSAYRSYDKAKEMLNSCLSNNS